MGTLCFSWWYLLLNVLSIAYDRYMHMAKWNSYVYYFYSMMIVQASYEDTNCYPSFQIPLLQIQLFSIIIVVNLNHANTDCSFFYLSVRSRKKAPIHSHNKFRGLCTVLIILLFSSNFLCPCNFSMANIYLSSIKYYNLNFLLLPTITH